MRPFMKTIAGATVALVALAGCTSDDDGTDDNGDATPTATAPASPTGAATDDAAASSTVSILGTNDLAFDPPDVSAAAGEITVELTSGSGVNHTFTVETPDGDVEVAAAPVGGSDSGTITLEAGTYTFYCSVGGHRDAGMEGTLTVE